MSHGSWPGLAGAPLVPPLGVELEPPLGVELEPPAGIAASGSPAE
jgi:hypothetical protein